MGRFENTNIVKVQSISYGRIGEYFEVSIELLYLDFCFHYIPPVHIR